MVRCSVWDTVVVFFFISWSSFLVIMFNWKSGFCFPPPILSKIRSTIRDLLPQLTSCASSFFLLVAFATSLWVYHLQPVVVWFDFFVCSCSDYYTSCAFGSTTVTIVLVMINEIFHVLYLCEYCLFFYIFFDKLMTMGRSTREGTRGWWNEKRGWWFFAATCISTAGGRPGRGLFGWFCGCWTGLESGEEREGVVKQSISIPAKERMERIF